MQNTLFIVGKIFLFSDLLVTAIVLDVNDPKAIRHAAGVAALGVQSLYNGNTTGGELGKWPYPPYYWWQSGATWGGMIDYWHATGDESYVEVTHEGVVAQIGPTNDFLLPEEEFNTGNDDQGFWVLTAMTAAEHDFPLPPKPYATWQQICDNVFNHFTQRWEYDADTCGGGLRWHFNPDNNGHEYKNSISNGAFFQLAARLARMTGNETYAEWARKVWAWETEIGLIDRDYRVFDGTTLTLNCTEINHNEWSYNVAIHLYGAAVMQNHTGGSKEWISHTSGLLNSAEKFFSPFYNATNIMYEPRCEPSATCNEDQRSMKAYLSRWMAGTSQLAPQTTRRIGELLHASATGAASACTGGPFGNMCGTKWYIDGWDGSTGLGPQLSAMEVIQGLLVNETAPPPTPASFRSRSTNPDDSGPSRSAPEQSTTEAAASEETDLASKFALRQPSLLVVLGCTMAHILR